MSIAAVLPTFNRRRLLERALTSVFAQTLPPAEVIVVDDGSVDDTRRLVTSRFPDARYVRQGNRGVSAARNSGIRESTAEWIALLDSDDEWLPDKLARQRAALEASPGYDLCHCDEVWIRGGRRVNQGRRHAKAGGRIFRRCLPLCVISPSASVIRRTVFDRIGYFDEQLPACEDYDFWLRFCARHPVLYLPEPLVVKHGGRRDQLSRTVEGLDQYRVRALDKLLASGILGEEDAAATRRVLVEKAEIFAAGARKRDRLKAAEEVLALAAAHGGSGNGRSGGRA